MQFDDGEVLQGLDENWTFMGANAMEWACGLVVFLLISLFADSPARAMPFMLVGWILTTTTLAALRRSFPDQERGVRNAVATSCGFPPPGVGVPTSDSAKKRCRSLPPFRGGRMLSPFWKMGRKSVTPPNCLAPRDWQGNQYPLPFSSSR